LPELPYAYDALEPYIDAETMKVHHTKHHAGYAAKFNAAVKKAGITGKNAREILSEASRYPDAVVNNGGGFLNHRLFWMVLSPKGGGIPDGELLNAINDAFGSFEKFRDEFSGAARTLFGSGWVWLILAEGKLRITATQNQDSPLMDTAEVKGTPLLLIDVWEHAYYLKYQNRRAEYINAFWNIVNWEFVSKKYSRLMQG
jgi:Fe-Mn family superoxide dismutase